MTTDEDWLLAVTGEKRLLAATEVARLLAVCAPGVAGILGD